MARLFYVFGAILVWGLVQANVISKSGNEAFIEDIRGVSSRIVGGWPANEGEFPYQVSLRMVSSTGGASACGGSIIHNEWVITAAHCLANRITFVVRLGLIDLARPEYLLESTQKYIYPGYIEIQGGVQTHDIGLLGLGRYVEYGPNIQPCRLQNSDQKNINYDQVVLSVSGYGRTNDWWLGGELSEVLLWTHLRGISNEDCLSWYPYSQVIKEQTICATYYNDTTQTSCTGDSGGPLVHPDIDGKPTMIGIVSFGHAAGCSSPHPAGYVRPGHYHSWFTEVTGIDFDWKSEDLETSKVSGTQNRIKPDYVSRLQ